MDDFKYLDIDRTEHEPTISEDKKRKFKNGFQGALRFATYLEDAHYKSSYTDYIETVSVKDFEEVQQFYLDDYCLRPYSKIFKQTIGDISQCKFDKSKRIKKILKRIAYNDIMNFMDFMLTDAKMKKHYDRLLNY